MSTNLIGATGGQFAVRDRKEFLVRQVSIFVQHRFSPRPLGLNVQVIASTIWIPPPERFPVPMQFPGSEGPPRAA